MTSLSIRNEGLGERVIENNQKLDEKNQELKSTIADLGSKVHQILQTSEGFDELKIVRVYVYSVWFVDIYYLRLSEIKIADLSRMLLIQNRILMKLLTCFVI